VSIFDALRHRLYVVRRGEEYGREVHRELRFHQELDRLAKTSGTPHRDEIAPRLGNATYYREEVRRMTTLHWLDRIAQDMMYAWRGLKRSPGFTATVVVTLALGIGVNAAMFSLLDRLFVRSPAGVAAPHDIVRVYQELSRPRETGGRLAFDSFRYPQYRALRRADSTLQVALFTEPDSVGLVQGEARTPIRRSLVTASYFAVLGVRPQIGRLFAPEEDRIEEPSPVAIISDALWRNVYRGDQSVIGAKMVINDKPFTIIGVAPKNFTGIDLDAVDVWAPANMYGSSAVGPEPWYDTFQNSFRVIGRAPDAPTRERMTVLGTSAIRSVHLRGFEYDSTAVVLTGSIVRALGPAKRAQELSISTRLAGVALVVLLIACANVANLLLVRATRRQREVAVRRALGVSTARLFQQLLTESLVLSAIGGVAALLFAFWAGNALRRLMLPSTHWAGSSVDVRTVVFATVVVLVVGIVAGLAPALQASRPDLVNSLKAGTREGAYRRSRLRSALLITQAALSIVLLIGAGLFVSSLRNIRNLDLGYDTENVMLARPVFGTTPPDAEIATALPLIAEQLRDAPGVEAIATASTAPMAGYSAMRLFLPDRDSLPTFGDQRGASYVGVSPGFFRAAGVRLIAGRDFTSTDGRSGRDAVIVSQAMGRLFWPGENPIGKCLILADRANPCTPVVGVVEDVHSMRVIETPSLQYYLPLGPKSGGSARELIVRPRHGEAATVSRLVAQELKRAFPRMLFPRLRSLDTALESQFRPWRLGATLFTAFGLLALAVASVGVYSVVAYAVSQRTHEMGVRLALGARFADIVQLVLGESSRVVAIGIATGILASLALGRLVASLLYGISPRDPVVMASAAGLMLFIALLASFVPGWRAARVDPSTALRAD
jgi:predicted permease